MGASRPVGFPSRGAALLVLLEPASDASHGCRAGRCGKAVSQVTHAPHCPFYGLVAAGEDLDACLYLVPGCVTVSERRQLRRQLHSAGIYSRKEVGTVGTGSALLLPACCSLNREINKTKPEKTRASQPL